MPVSTKYALRSLARHKRRSILSGVGIGVGCAVCMFMISFVRGESEMMKRAAAESGTGHLLIVPEGWADIRSDDMRLENWQEILEQMRGMEEVAAATPRARADALLAFGTRLTGVQMAGVDPDTEQATNRLVRNVTEGRYLTKGELGTTVVGQALCDRLDVELDDDLMVTVSGKDGEMLGAMLRIVGIVSTGSKVIDSTICHVNMEEVEQLTGYEGAANVTVLLRDGDLTHPMAQGLPASLPAGTSVLTWEEMLPELASGVEVDKTWSRIIVSLVTLVVFLGIASAQLAAVLERRKEFAVLSALGMKGGALTRVMILEGFFLGGVGGCLGVMIGVPTTYLIATVGLDFRWFVKDFDMSISNILVDPIIFGDFGWWLLPLAFGLSLTSTVLSSLYPAWYAAKTDPAAALRVDH